LATEGHGKVFLAFALLELRKGKAMFWFGKLTIKIYRVLRNFSEGGLALHKNLKTAFAVFKLGGRINLSFKWKNNIKLI